jgi:hypothetical protein
MFNIINYLLFNTKIKIGSILSKLMNRHRDRLWEVLPKDSEREAMGIWEKKMQYGLSDIRFQYLWENIENNPRILPEGEDYRLSKWYRYTTLYKEIWNSLTEKTFIAKVKRILS